MAVGTIPRHLRKLREYNPALACPQIEAFTTQIPVLYVILLVNSGFLSATHFAVAPLWLSLIWPVLLAVACAARAVVWIRRNGRRIDEATAVRQIKVTVWMVRGLGLLFTSWALALYPYGDAYQQFHVAFYMAITVISCVFCLTHVKQAALSLAMVVVAPFVIFFCRTGNPVFVAIAINLVLVTAGMIFILVRNYGDFARLILAQIETRRLSDENLYLASRDSLTGLPNRRRFFAGLDEALLATPSGERFAVVLLDLDGFKAVNDAYGHTAGDRLLAEVGERLQTISRPCLDLARIGGDEFAAILRGNPSEEDVVTLGQSLCDLLLGPYLTTDISAEVTASIGLAIYPDCGTTPGRLFDCADYALYHVKQTTRGRAVVFSSEHEETIRNNSQIEQALRQASVCSELSLVYQPIRDVASARTICFEALARWRHPIMGDVPPVQFIAVAERANLISGLTRILFGKALEAAASWPESVRLSFNLSAQDLMSTETVQALLSLIKASTIESSRIDFEITETAVMRDFGRAEAAIGAIRDLGCLISLDDFGTGFSSLSHVHRLRPDKVKIDRGFVTDIETNEAAQAIVKTMVDMCCNLGIDCVVEGVETAEQKRVLTTLGCSLMQGYFFSRPLSRSATHDYLGRMQIAENGSTSPARPGRHYDAMMQSA